MKHARKIYEVMQFNYLLKNNEKNHIYKYDVYTIYIGIRRVYTRIL